MTETSPRLVERAAKQQCAVRDRQRYRGNSCEFNGRLRVADDGAYQHHRADEVVDRVGEDDRTPEDTAENQPAVDPVQGSQAQPRRPKQLTEPQPVRWVTRDEARKNGIGGKQQDETGYAEPERAGS